MKYKKTNLLVMPVSFYELSKDEMMYIEGGLRLATLRDFLNKSVCASVARTYIKNCGWKNITESQLKKEIYGHAFVKYNMPILKNSGIPYLQDIYNRAANGIDIEDKVDDRQIAFELLWNF